MKNPKSLKQRIVWSMTGIVMLVLTLVVSTIFYIYITMENQVINSWIQSESARLQTRIGKPDNKWTKAFERHITPTISAWGESAAFPAASMPPSLRALPIGVHHLTEGTQDWHITISNFKDGRFYVLYDAKEHAKRVDGFGLLLCAIALLSLIAAYFLSVRIAGWIISPLELVTQRLIRWAPGTPSVFPEDSDEATRSIVAFNQVQNQVDESRAREKEFAANLHHEIRTPLARIRSDSELTLRAALQDSNATLRLHRIMTSVDEITTSLDSTYELANAHDGTPEAVMLHDCLEEVFLRMQPEAHVANLVLVNHLDIGHTAVVDKSALFTVMRNLVQNAIIHAAPATLEISSIPNGLKIVDNGTGIPSTDLPHIFERYYSQRLTDVAGNRQSQTAESPTHKTGLGLAIVHQICIAQEWDIHVQSPPEGMSHGTAFYLTLTSKPYHESK